MVQYEVWDYETGNCIGCYATKAEALAALAEDARRLGAEAHATTAIIAVADEAELARLRAELASAEGCYHWRRGQCDTAGGGG